MTSSAPTPDPTSSSAPSGDHVWDVAVVGGGPAGSSAALAAARAGRSVVLLEKACFPRYKTCGGGLIGVSTACLPPGVAAPLKDEVRSVVFTVDGRYRRVRSTRAPMFGLTSRVDLDDRLAQEAVKAGAELREDTAVQRIAQDADAVTLTLAGGEPLRARAVVGADGSAGRTSAYVGVRFDQVDLGLEEEIPVPPEVAAYWRGKVLIDWGPLPGSYGWVFPKGDVLTVGVICARGNGEATRGYLRDMIARLGLAGFPPSTASGHLTRCRAENSPLASGRVLVAGDAAGLLEPWTREGISYALRSGRAAGEAAALIAASAGEADVAAAVAGYRDGIDRTLGREMRAGRRMLDAFERYPKVFHGAISVLPQAWSAFRQVVEGRASVADLQERGVTQRALRLLRA